MEVKCDMEVTPERQEKIKQLLISLIEDQYKVKLTPVNPSRKDSI